MPVIARYAIVTLIPALLIALGATVWGFGGVLALIWLTLVAAGMDRLLDPPVLDDHDHAPWSDRLALGLGVIHFALVPLVLLALGDPRLSFGETLALLFATASFMGQVSHPNAHELIHRKTALSRGIGAAVYTSVGFGHHVSAHRLVHHRHVGTPDDPSTPLPGESFWAYLPRAWRGSFEAGLACEVDRLERRGLSGLSAHNPYVVWVGGAALSLVIALVLAGVGGALALIVLAALFGGQVLMSDYIQHYGLQRLELPNGRVEPVAPHHSWNAPRGFSSYLMMNAPAHSEHHMHPDRPYDRLDPQADVPTLPWSLPVMATLAMVPSVWHRVMDRRALRVMEAAQARLTATPPVRPRHPRRDMSQPVTEGGGVDEDDAALMARIARMVD
ncbi:alkane 1-monooxygenase [Roseicyclus mahoneyensis]|uniref:Alkane 1-monooxygenase n=1 Tax=Roseicyclus mahoneyensis TaxID=164332 RepID=A0A316GNR9_9RHOB|nr:alkane 1-monooxygenase [Roseicyclus mahoneyensis]PWK61103.1 alkane 1-monooxygenase [Roseicyclus mahoneyensis]